jgi:hypothetical protein
MRGECHSCLKVVEHGRGYRGVFYCEACYQTVSREQEQAKRERLVEQTRGPRKLSRQPVPDPADKP